MKSITSEANPHFRRWLRLASTPRAVREDRATLAEGIHLAQAALEAGVAVHAALVRHGLHHEQALQVLEQLPAAVPRFELSAALYERLAPVEQGAGIVLVLAVSEPPLPQRLRADMVYLDGVQDPGNVGALLRTAAAAGAGHVLAGPGTAALWSPKVLRAGMGAHFRLRLFERVDAGQIADLLDGCWVAAVAHDAPSLWEARFPAGAIGWAFGAEGSGLSAATLEACRMRVRVPTSSAVESLNVGAAAAICLFERERRRAMPG
jgi:TrmH family RNA methyltransferase